MKNSEIISSVVTFIVRQIAKYGAEQVNWELVKADASKRIADLVPGEMFDSFAVSLIEKVVELVKQLCMDPKAFEDIKAAIEKKDYAALIKALVEHSKSQIVA